MVINFYFGLLVEKASIMGHVLLRLPLLIRYLANTDISRNINDYFSMYCVTFHNFKKLDIY